MPFDIKSFNDIDPEVWEEIDYKAAKLGLEYADNFRAYVVGDEAGKQRFIEAHKRGCCGSWEGGTTIGGIKYVIGCNYGH